MIIIKTMMIIMISPAEQRRPCQWREFRVAHSPVPPRAPAHAEAPPLHHHCHHHRHHHRHHYHHDDRYDHHGRLNNEGQN